MKKSQERKYFWVGLAIMLVVFGALAVSAVVFTPNFSRPKTIVESYFSESINGLSVGAPVKFKGIPIGEVTQIELSALAYPRAKIGMFSDTQSLAVVRMRVFMDKKELQAQLPDMIKHGLRIQTQLSGLTGTLYLEATLLDPEKYPDDVVKYSWKPKHLYVPSAISLSNEILNNVQNFLATLHSFDEDASQDNDGKKTLQDILETVVGLDRFFKTVHPEQIVALLDQLNQTSDRATEFLSKTQVESLNDFLKQLTASADKLQALLDNSNNKELSLNLIKFSEKANSMVINNRYDVKELLSNLRVMTANLVQLTNNIKNNPSLLLRRSEPQKTPY